MNDFIELQPDTAEWVVAVMLEASYQLYLEEYEGGFGLMHRTKFLSLCEAGVIG